MRTTSFLLGMLFLVHISCNLASGQQNSVNLRTQVQDPIFGISYSYTKVHYENMPTSIRHVCPNYEKGTFWTFAHVQRNSRDYYVVMGVAPGQDGDSLGAALVVEGSDCTASDSTWMLSGYVPSGGYRAGESSGELPGLGAPKVCADPDSCHYVLRSAEEEGLLRDLVRDALSRGVQAWGEDRFRKEACTPSIQQANSSTPIIQQELTKFCNDRK